jgi:hypothetical protein
MGKGEQGMASGEPPQGNGESLQLFAVGYSTRPYELPIRIPATNTSTPPTTTWNAACRNGVSM